MSDQGRFAEQPFFGNIVNVGWASGAVVIVEVTTPETKFYEVASLDPPDIFTEFFGGLAIDDDDYADKYILRMGSQGNTGSVVTEDELEIWRWDGFYVGGLGDPANAAAVSNGNATFGYAANIHLTGQQVAHNTAAFNRPLLGDYVTHTHPNGSMQTYASGYTPLGVAYVGWHGPTQDWFGYVIRPGTAGGYPEPPQDLGNTESWYWYRIQTQPEQTAAVLRRSFLVNCRSDFVITAELRDFTVALDQPLDWSIKGYPQGTAFTIADGRMTPVGGVLPRFEAEGSVPGGHSGTIRKFNASGFIS